MKVELQLPRPADDCYREFCDPAVTRLWLPGLEQLRVVRTDEQGRAVEVHYLLGESLTYALVYAYDDLARRVRWVPSAGGLDGVSGHVSFEPHPDGCTFSYSLDSLRGRAPLHAEEVAAAFAAWIRKSAPGR